MGGRFGLIANFSAYLTARRFVVGPTGFEPVTNPECFRGCSNQKVAAVAFPAETARGAGSSSVSTRVPNRGLEPKCQFPRRPSVPTDDRDAGWNGCDRPGVVPSAAPNRWWNRYS